MLYLRESWSVRVFGHVFLQVKGLGVTLSTVRADVNLEMLGLLVFGDVVEEGFFVVETFVATKNKRIGMMKY